MYMMLMGWLSHRCIARWGKEVGCVVDGASLMGRSGDFVGGGLAKVANAFWRKVANNGVLVIDS